MLIAWYFAHPAPASEPDENPLMRSSAQRSRLRRVVPFGLIWLAFGIVYSIVVKGLLGDSTTYPATGIPYDFLPALVTTAGSSLLMGLGVGAIEALFDGRLFSGFGFGARILLKTVLYTGGVLLFLLFINTIYLSLVLDLGLFDGSVWEKNLDSLGAPWFWSIIVYIGSIATLSLYFSELQQHLGHSVIGNFFTGRYLRPRQEERIFMFLDMRSSTTLAERMGHVRYFELLNRYYADVTAAIGATSGEVLQYVGDEVVITWTLDQGLRENDCLVCFFRIQDALQARSQDYLREFGLVPGFKAGLHFGPVATGEVGTVRKEIVFTGDVMNTTARIQSLCNETGVDLLVSEALMTRLSPGAAYHVREVGLRDLKGKDQQVRLFTVTK